MPWRRKAVTTRGNRFGADVYSKIKVSTCLIRLFLHPALLLRQGAARYLRSSESVWASFFFFFNFRFFTPLCFVGEKKKSGSWRRIIADRPNCIGKIMSFHSLAVGVVFEKRKKEHGVGAASFAARLQIHSCSLLLERLLMDEAPNPPRATATFTAKRPSDPDVWMRPPPPPQPSTSANPNKISPRQASSRFLCPP